MPYTVNIISKDYSDYPSALQEKDISTRYPHIWIIGNFNILDRELLGFFCSVKCPGNVILKTYDLVRKLRDAGIPVVSGFHSPIEKDCLDLLLKGTQPVVICPARGIENMRMPKIWQKALTENRLLIISPFDPKYRRPTAKLAEQRNEFVASLAAKIFVAHANKGGRIERLSIERMALGKPIYTFNARDNSNFSRSGALIVSTGDLIADFS
jgi:predicted Rossmann fold nucleotide-binding protein DprA/Smf involved in DNA uptake